MSKQYDDSLFCLIFAALSKAPPPPPPPPPQGEKEKDDAPVAAEEEEEKEFELPFKILGHPVKIPKLTRLPRLPDWLRVIMKYRFPSSIDPYTGEPNRTFIQQRSAPIKKEMAAASAPFHWTKMMSVCLRIKRIITHLVLVMSFNTRVSIA